MTRIRDDKLPKDATTLAELENLFKISKEQVLTLDENVGNHDDVEASDEDEEQQRYASGGRSDGGESSENDEEQKPKNVRSEPKKRRAKVSETHSGSESDSSQRLRKKIKTEKASPQSTPRKRTNGTTATTTAAVDGGQTQSTRRNNKIPPCDLPCVFSGIVIEALPGEPHQYDNLRRYFVAYGGKFSETEVTHRIGTAKGSTKVDWLLESLKRRRLLDEKLFQN